MVITVISNYLGVTNTEENHPDDEPSGPGDTAEGVRLDRRSYLGLVGTTVASLTAGRAEAETDGLAPSAGTVGYGGMPTIATRLSVPDPFADADQPQNSQGGAVTPSGDVSQLEADGQFRSFEVPDQYDLFEFDPGVDSALTVTFDGSQAVGAAVLGIFDPNGDVVEQVYMDADAPVYIPERTEQTGTHYLQVAGLEGSSGAYALSVSTDQTTSAQSPYEGTAHIVPGRVQAENFDVGGEGVAYHDTTDGSEYDLSYRDTSVDIRETGDESGDYNIGYFEDGEWLEYTIAPTPGTYDLQVRVASARSNRQLDVTLGGESLGTVDVPNTGDWTNWETVTLEDVTITSDESQVLRLEAVRSGIDLNWFEFDAIETKGPYEGTAWSVPGQIQAEDFDTGGEGVSYYDTTDGNEYDVSYRNASVDIRETGDESGDYNIGYFEDGEWLEYTVDPDAGTYDLRVRLASANSGRQLDVSLDGESLTTVDVPNTGGWTNWETVTIEGVTIESDTQSVLRFEAVGSGIDFNWFEFERVEVQGPFGGTVPTLPGRIQAENFDTGGEGVAYHDTSDGNEYDITYRDLSVDIRETGDESGAYNVGYFMDGEWLEYTVSPTPDTYDIHFRIATARSDRQLDVSLDGESLGTVDIPNTDDWSNWQTVTLQDVEVTADSESVLRLEAVGSGIDINWVEFEPATQQDSGSTDDGSTSDGGSTDDGSTSDGGSTDDGSTSDGGSTDDGSTSDGGSTDDGSTSDGGSETTQSPYTDAAATVPGRVEAEDFDAGGQGVAYSDTTDGNEYATAYRDTSVDIRESGDEGGGYNIGYFDDGEWLEYTIDPTGGNYDLRVRVATTNSDRQFEVTLDGESLGTIDIPNTGDWSNWETVRLRNLTLPGDGTHVLRFEAVGAGIDFNWFEFVESTDSDYGELGFGEAEYGATN